MSVRLRYLGTSDEFDLGDGVVAQKGGDPVEIDEELAERVTHLPGEQFENVNDEEWAEFQKVKAERQKAAEEQERALEAAGEKYREEAEAQAEARGGFYGARTQEEADAAVRGAPEAPVSPSPEGESNEGAAEEQKDVAPQRPERPTPAASRTSKGDQAVSDPEEGEEK